MCLLFCPRFTLHWSMMGQCTAPHAGTSNSSMCWHLPIGGNQGLNMRLGLEGGGVWLLRGRVFVVKVCSCVQVCFPINSGRVVPSCLVEALAVTCWSMNCRFSHPHLVFPQEENTLCLKCPIFHTFIAFPILPSGAQKEEALLCACLKAHWLADSFLAHCEPNHS